jgi:hypothetical protein
MKPFATSARGIYLGISIVGALLAGVGDRVFATCGPFTDTASDAFCPFVLEIFTLGITTGTTATTYSPGDGVTRLQMAAFLSRTVDAVLRRGRARTMLERGAPASLGITTVGTQPRFCVSDGADIWVANTLSNQISRVRSSDGKLLETWTGAPFNYAAVVAPQGLVFVSQGSPSQIFQIIPSQPAGSVTTVVSDLGDSSSHGIAFDGARFWTCNAGSVSIVTPAASPPWTVTTVTTGFNRPEGALFDGSNIWITDVLGNTLLKLGAGAVVLQTVTLGTNPEFPVFDGTNLWVPVSGINTMAVVRASSGAILAMLTGNGMNDPLTAAFDGERVLVTNVFGDQVSLWKAADFTPLGAFPTGSGTKPIGACSDGANFWVTLLNVNQIARF